MDSSDYLKKILNARVYDVAKETKLEYAPQLSHRLNNKVFLKREDSQSVFSFKLRGAYNKIFHLSAEERARGIITASAGNHAQGVALSAAKLKCKALIVMPITTPQVKIDAVRVHGGDFIEVVLFGDSYTDAYHHAFDLQKKQNLTFVHPFDDPDVIAGQGTIGMEILHQYPNHIEAIFIPIGGGGLIAGIAAYVKALRPDIKIIGVQTVDSSAMAQSLKLAKRLTLSNVGIFSDGTAVKEVGEETFRLCQQYVDDIIEVDTDALCAAIKDVFQDTRSLLEPAGALAIAGLKMYVEDKKLNNTTLIALASGANLNFDRMRFIAERAEVGEAREALFAITIPEERGSFLRFCNIIDKRSITAFNYRMANKNDGNIFVGIQIKDRDEGPALKKMFEENEFKTIDLTHNELAKQHIRHMVGGHSPLAKNELLYRFRFPERPGALINFLSSMKPTWNISLFHYRNEGADYSDTLVGLQIPTIEFAQFQDFLAKLGYNYSDETNNPVYQLFLG